VTSAPRTIFITGAASGIGRETAGLFAERAAWGRQRIVTTLHSFQFAEAITDAQSHPEQGRGHTDPVSTMLTSSASTGGERPGALSFATVSAGAQPAATRRPPPRPRCARAPRRR
jgi:NAD(P)-dependent dehydrogenase (short-subunit alcohol dehydrogenase family)